MAEPMFGWDDDIKESFFKKIFKRIKKLMT
jgi:hypothetical protein